jgi:hypothetical protein
MEKGGFPLAGSFLGARTEGLFALKAPLSTEGRGERREAPSRTKRGGREAEERTKRGGREALSRTKRGGREALSRTKRGGREALSRTESLFARLFPRFFFLQL